jgi:hypothetical protein
MLVRRISPLIWLMLIVCLAITAVARPAAQANRATAIATLTGIAHQVYDEGPSFSAGGGSSHELRLAASGVSTLVLLSRSANTPSDAGIAAATEGVRSVGR